MANPISPNWRSLIIKLSVWLLIEVCFTLIGTDDLADYGEFVFSSPSQSLAGPSLIITTI